MTMDQFVSNVTTLSGQGNFHELSDYLSKSHDLLFRNASQLASVLERLDVQQHSLGVMAVLSARLQQNLSQIDGVDLLNHVADFLVECNGEQIRHAPQNFADFCHLFANKLIKYDVPLLGLASLLKAINKIQVNENALTSVSADVFKICLVTKCFPPAIKLLKLDITEISAEAANGDAKHILLYFYYGALILMAIKDYDRALYFLEICVTMPALIASHIVMAAYKKYLLVLLIVAGDHGKDNFVLPRYTSPLVYKSIKPLCNPYNDLSNAFYTNDMGKLMAVINKSRDIFDADQNLGLVHQVKDSLLKANIKRLTMTFLTLSLEDVASRVGLECSREAEKWILVMIEEGSIHATISQKDGMVRFDSNPEGFASVRMLKRLEESINECTRLDSKIRSLDEEILLNPNFIKKSNAGSASTSGGPRKNSDFDMGNEVGPSSSGHVATSSSSTSAAADEGIFAAQSSQNENAN